MVSGWFWLTQLRPSCIAAGRLQVRGVTFLEMLQLNDIKHLHVIVKVGAQQTQIATTLGEYSPASPMGWPIVQPERLT